MLDWWRAPSSTRSTRESFADANGDGIGDIAGIRTRLPYLAALGVDAIWVNPWYPSPQADGGYDVADFREIDPRFGTLADADALIREAHALGLRVILDIVPNHISDEHPWFRAALAAAPGLAGAGPSTRSGPAGARPAAAAERLALGLRRARPGSASPSADGTPGDGTCTCSTRASRTSTGTTREVRDEFEDILRFWFDRGARRLPDRRRARAGQGSRAARTSAATREHVLGARDRGDHPHWDRPEVHDICRAWRRIADATTRRGSSWARRGLAPADGWPRTCAPTSCTRPSTSTSRWPLGSAGRLRAVIDASLAAPRPGRCAGDVGAREPRHAAVTDPVRAEAAGMDGQRPLRPRRGRSGRPAGPGAAALLHAGPARLGVPVPGRGAGAAGGRGPAGGGPPGPGVRRTGGTERGS